MNSEELELSLRAEFESYLKGVLAGMRQDVADFQKNFETEFEKHKAQTDEAFRNLSARFESDLKFDQAFTESVVEHLRLARDDGAQLSAKAFSDAQDLEKDAAPVGNYDRLRDAIDEIGSQTTQSAILRSLVDQVSHFTSRGAFFIVKHESFVCWRRFDRDGHAEDEKIREIHFPVTADTLLADAVRSLRTKDGASTPHTEDSVYLDAVGFDRPENMYAVPLIARGRGVAVLYTDQSADGQMPNLEAIESLVRVAGLTVELRAAAASVQVPADAPSPAATPAAESAPEPESETASPEYDAYVVEKSYAVVEDSTVSALEAQIDDAAVEEYTGDVAVDEPVQDVQHIETPEDSFVSTVDESYFEPVVQQEESVMQPAEYYVAGSEVESRPAEPVNDFAFASSDAYDGSADVDPEPEPDIEAEPVEEYAYAGEVKNGNNGHSYEVVPEPVVEVASAQPVKSRLSDRHVDLPIEVADDERRLHNDARRFARLLVSEIKLYNEQKVNEGRSAGDLYDRLREAIERSREMYDKRVQPQVAAKFDYFHYELVNNLAEGSDVKLGASYPGATV